MTLVLDTSIVIPWCFPDEDSMSADRALEWTRDYGAEVPAIWWYELRNVLLTGERRGRIEAADAAGFLREISGLAIRVDWPDSEGALMDLARRYGLTVYDAAYLELALRQGYPLATLDRRLADAAKHAGVSLFNLGPA